MKLLFSLILCLVAVAIGASSIEINSGTIVANNYAHIVFATGSALHNNTGTPFYSDNTASAPASTETTFYGPEGSNDAFLITPTANMGTVIVNNYSGVLYPYSSTVVPRWWIVTATAEQPFDLKVRLRNTELSGFTQPDLRVWEHDSSTGWHLLSGAPVNISAGSTFTELSFSSLQFFGAKKGSHNIMLGYGDEGTLPVELSSFSATLNAYNYISLQWVTQTETNVSGFRIYRGTSDDMAASEMLNVFINGTNTSQLQTYVFVDEEVSEAGVYYYWLENLEMDGASMVYGPTSVTFTTGGGIETPEIPLTNSIESIYPNPFNPNVSIKYALKTPANTQVLIYNVRGQLVRKLFAGDDIAGRKTIEWNGKDNSGSACSSGIYTVVIKIGKETLSSRMVLSK